MVIHSLFIAGTRAPGPGCKEMLLPTVFHPYIDPFPYIYSFIFYMCEYMFIPSFVFLSILYTNVYLYIHFYSTFTDYFPVPNK